MNLIFTEPEEGSKRNFQWFLPNRSTAMMIMRINLFYMLPLFACMQGIQAHTINGQSLDKIYATIEIKNESLETLFQKLKEKTGMSFVFPRNKVMTYENINLSKTERSVKKILDLVLKDKPLAYRQEGNTVLIYVLDKKHQDFKRNGALKTAIKNVAATYKSMLGIVTGTVTNVDGPMAGVNVLVRGTIRGTTTDIEGKFSIEATDNNILVFSFIGYETFETQVNGRSVIDVLMEQSSSSLKEVVINAGYWNINKYRSSGNISKISSKDIEQQPVSNPLQALQGRVTGLQITQLTGVPGGGFDVRIRGQNSISSGNDPLYIVNGVPYTATPVNSGLAGGPNASVSPLNFINPRDIESIEVLKDADATAIYGSRGANGVILITTKVGKSGKTAFDISAYSGIGKVSKKINLLNREQYLEMRNEAFANDEAIPGATDYDLNGTWDNTRETDWQDVLIGGTAQISNIDANISGGNSNTRFLLGAGCYKETTVFPGDFDFKKTSMNFNVNHMSVDQKFTLSFSGFYLINNSNLLQSDLTRDALTLPPVAPALFDETGDLNWENSTWLNPLSATMSTYETQTDNLIGNATIQYDVTPAVAFKVNTGYSSLLFNETILLPNTRLDPALNSTSRGANFGTSSVRTWIIEPQILFDKTFGKSTLSALLGATFQEDKRGSATIFAFGFSSDALLKNLSAASNISISGVNNSIYRYNAMFGRINYSWDEKYIINLTARRDGSSRFGPVEQFANFGAVGIAWIFSNEKFLKDSPFLNFGKFRASYGTTGNDQIGNYQFLDTYSPTLPYQGISALRPTRLYNPDFSWETTKKFEMALELGLLNDRIFLAGSYYLNRSKNQLLNFPLAPTTGFLGIQNNLPATVQNTGLELELSTTNFKNKAVTWTTALNVSFPRNKLIRYPDIETSPFARLYKAGESLNIQNTLKFLEVDPASGIIKYEDLNENGFDLEDLKFSKEIGREYYGGLQNSITYKGLQLNFLLQFVKQTGFRLRNGTPGSMENQPIWIIDRWQKPGDVTNTSQFTQSFSNPAFLPYILGSISDLRIIDASFVRLQNVSLSYSFNNEWLETINLQSLKIYFQAQNLFTVTDFQGLDPGNPSSSGISLPALMVLTLGAQLTF